MPLLLRELTPREILIPNLVWCLALNMEKSMRDFLATRSTDGMHLPAEEREDVLYVKHAEEREGACIRRRVKITNEHARLVVDNNMLTKNT